MKYLVSKADVYAGEFKEFDDYDEAVEYAIAESWNDSVYAVWGNKEGVPALALVFQQRVYEKVE